MPISRPVAYAQAYDARMAAIDELVAQLQRHDLEDPELTILAMEKLGGWHQPKHHILGIYNAKPAIIRARLDMSPTTYTQKWNQMILPGSLAEEIEPVVVRQAREFRARRVRRRRSSAARI